MSIFQEIDEEVRRERLKQLWDKWGIYIIALALLVILGVGGWRGWEWWQARKSAAAGDAFQAALALSEAGKHAEAEAAFTKIVADAPYGYRVLARLRAAEELSASDRPAAVKAFDEIAADSSVGGTMQELAAVRAGLLLVDTANYDEIRSRLEQYTTAGHPFRHTARELLAVSASRAGDSTAARRWFDMIQSDPETPSGTRARIDMLVALSAAGDKS